MELNDKKIFVFSNLSILNLWIKVLSNNLSSIEAPDVLLSNNANLNVISSSNFSKLIPPLISLLPDLIEKSPASFWRVNPKPKPPLSFIVLK
mgnify:CR=1 FL=1